MPSFNFFASGSDVRALLEFVFEQTDCRVFEAYSEPDQPLREFTTTDEVARAFDLGRDVDGTSLAPYLAFWSPEAMSGVTRTRIDFEPRYARRSGTTHRYSITGPALITLQFGGEHGRTVTASRASCNSEKRAAAWAKSFDPSITVDWTKQRKLMNRIRYHVERRLAAARVPGRAVLPGALRKHREGFELVDRPLSFVVGLAESSE